MASFAGKKIRNSFLADFFECSVCTEYALPPIYQCKSGHVICSECRAKLSFPYTKFPLCPSCRQPMDAIRNLALEKISSVIAFPCTNAASGCPVKAIPAEKEGHENLCEYRQVPCPLSQFCLIQDLCKWQGTRDNIIVHIYQDHPSIKTFEGEDLRFCVANIFDNFAVRCLMLQEVKEKFFLVGLIKSKERKFYVFVVLLDSPELVTQYTYRVELKVDKKRLSWEATPKKVFGETSATLGCLKFDEETAALFVVNGYLYLNVGISKETNNKSDSVAEIETLENVVEIESEM